MNTYFYGYTFYNVLYILALAWLHIMQITYSYEIIDVWYTNGFPDFYNRSRLAHLK